MAPSPCFPLSTLTHLSNPSFPSGNPSGLLVLLHLLAWCCPGPQWLSLLFSPRQFREPQVPPRASSPQLRGYSPPRCHFLEGFLWPSLHFISWLCPLDTSPLALPRAPETQCVKLSSGPWGCSSCRERYSLHACSLRPHPWPCSLSGATSAGCLLPEARHPISRWKSLPLPHLSELSLLCSLGHHLSKPHHS